MHHHFHHYSNYNYLTFYTLPAFQQRPKRFSLVV